MRYIYRIAPNTDVIMDTKAAEALLGRIQQEKQAESGYSGLTGMLPNFGADTSLRDDVIRESNQQLKSDSLNKVLRTMLAAGGLGAAARGATGLGRLFSAPSKPRAGRTVEMPVMYPRPQEEEEKVAKEDPVANSLFGGGTNDTATSPYGLTNYIPAMVLGGTLSAYGGWKGVDAIMDKQRQKRTQDELEQAKNEYEQALLGSYKKADDEGSFEADLDQVFESYEKQGEGMVSRAWEGLKDSTVDAFPNLPGTAKGLALTYALASAPAGYAVVNSRMKANSRRALLEKAMKERARRQAQNQPSELYAIPTPRDREKEEVQ